jgi:serine/threonine-protein kinase
VFPTSLGDYEILGSPFRNCTGISYKARDVRRDRLVTLKIMQVFPGQEERSLERFQREAEALADVCHRNVVQIYEVGDFGGCPYLVLEFVDGGTLADRLDGAAWPRKAAKLVEPLARAAQVVHERGLVHRDIKPANVLLTVDGEPKLTGFGLVMRMGEEGSGGIVGTPLYMPPEQARGRADLTGPPSDVYALGGVLYELLTGRPPFEAANVVELLRRVVNDQPAPPSRLNPQVPRALEAITLKCLTKDPRERYETAQALADDLCRFLNREKVRARGRADLTASMGLAWVNRFMGMFASWLGRAPFSQRLRRRRRGASPA